MPNSEQRTANSEQRTANSEQRTANSEQRTLNPPNDFCVGQVHLDTIIDHVAGLCNMNYEKAHDFLTLFIKEIVNLWSHGNEIPIFEFGVFDLKKASRGNISPNSDIYDGDSLIECLPGLHFSPSIALVKKTKELYLNKEFKHYSCLLGDEINEIPIIE